MFKNNDEQVYRHYMISICLVIALLLSGLFLGMSIRTKSLIMDELLASARAKFEMVLAMRIWNANYGGVYVEKRGDVQTNPYVKDADVEVKDGRVFTLRNPAMMTREVSEILGAEGDFAFHITSKKLINPSNEPSEFELRALDNFESGAKEYHQVLEQNGRMYFNFMGPLYIAESCLKCHSHQGYSVGDVRGGISVKFNMDEAYKKMRFNTWLVFLFSATTLVLFIGIFWLLTTKLMARLTEARRKIEEIATVDDLTKVHNRRYVNAMLAAEVERSKRLSKNLCGILIDIDNFKLINDSHGHSLGDEVLKEVALRVSSVIRGYDVFARYGGEEFVALFPETSIDEARKLAERILGDISGSPIQGLTVTVSIGLCSMDVECESQEGFLQRMDTLMYKAKSEGKNRVAWQ